MASPTPPPRGISARGALIAVAVVLALTADDRHAGKVSDGREVIGTAVAIVETGGIGIAKGAPRAVDRGDDAVSRYGLGASVAQVPAALLAPLVERRLGPGTSQPLFLLAPFLAVLLAAGAAGSVARLAGGAPAAPADLVVLPVTPASAVPIAGRRVLLAEDNVVNQKLALRVLRRAGCLVDLAENGAEACAFAESNAYDIVFMDCHMPEMDGFAAARTIRAREAMFPARRRMPIVALTASVLNSDRQRCLDSGMDDFIAKPFQPAQLEDAVRRWSGGAASEGPAREAA